MTTEYKEYQLKNNSTFPDKEGNYYCRILNIVRNRKVGAGVCSVGCPCYVQGEDVRGAGMCRYYQFSETESVETPWEYKNCVDALEAAGELPFFPEVDNISRRIWEAYAFAAYAHRNQKRKGSGVPYMTHLISAMEIAKGITEEEDVLIAVLLHDTLEDTDTTKDMLQEKFGGRVAELVAGDSEDKRRDRPASETWKERKIENISNIQNGSRETKIIALCDKLSNLRSIYDDVRVLGEATWERFHQKDKWEHRWYYGEFIKVLQDLKDTEAYKEYVELIEKVWQEPGKEPELAEWRNG